MATYRSDADLAFLKQCQNEDLELLVSVLTEDPKDSKKRLTETLTSCEEYKQHYPNHNRYWECIAAELQTFGANTLVTVFRGGQGVPYREILKDVCNKMKVNYNKNSTVEVIEMALLMKMLENTLNGLNQEELKNFCQGMGMVINNPTPEIILMTVQSTIKLSGFAAYKFATISLSYILRSLGMTARFATYTLLTQSLKVFTGPIGWTVTTGWLLADIASPAYRVTIPACVIVAFLRQKTLNDQNNS